ncbi:unnamed protein product [Didymodactylos carnosus]|uniref:C2H2-type domain-containing protein n=1 Tax=Didymodactylos carnosus TaxID=1234261 RepID=A0A814CPS4_9BILA|nr:unnamed protein product [Didymodactylos carnosus]CAF0944137.1 unnamed protein product [Didymodactylos carnosus]CAF3611281.1 unnamed protein product [Didymodactylos carnosus]CAF3720403.1 unnamed protein product [Didymodactylos carnosus]
MATATPTPKFSRKRSAATTTVNLKRSKLRKCSKSGNDSSNRHEEDTRLPFNGTRLKEWEEYEKWKEVRGDIEPTMNYVEVTPEAIEELKKIKNIIGDYICQLCKVKYENAFQLAMHKCPRVVHVEFRCPDCDKTFNCPANLASHRRWHKPENIRTHARYSSRSESCSTSSLSDTINGDEAKSQKQVITTSKNLTLEKPPKSAVRESVEPNIQQISSLITNHESSTNTFHNTLSSLLEPARNRSIHSTPFHPLLNISSPVHKSLFNGTHPLDFVEHKTVQNFPTNMVPLNRTFINPVLGHIFNRSHDHSSLTRLVLERNHQLFPMNHTTETTAFREHPPNNDNKHFQQSCIFCSEQFLDLNRLIQHIQKKHAVKKTNSANGNTNTSLTVEQNIE